MKKTISLLLALVMCLSLCACGGGNSPQDDSAKATTENGDFFSEYRMPKPKDVKFLGYSEEANAYFYYLGEGTDTDAIKNASSFFIDYVFSLSDYGIEPVRTDDFTYTLYVGDNPIAGVGIVVDSGSIVLGILFS